MTAADVKRPVGMPLTEAEIREAVQKHLDRVVETEGTNTPDWIAVLLDPLRFQPPDPETGHTYGNSSLWADLRPSQAARLAELEEWAFGKADALMLEVGQRLAEHVVEAALTFAAEYPDAPRAVREPVPA